ncbi:MAG: BrnT family toxin [Desulfomonilaceae bacterium]
MDVEYVLQDAVFIWDADKAEANLHDYSVSFEEACEVFFDPLYDMIPDDSVEGEQRWDFIGYSKADRALFVVGIELEDDVWRIISARELERKERLRYEEEDDTYQRSAHQTNYDSNASGCFGGSEACSSNQRLARLSISYQVLHQTRT